MNLKLLSDQQILHVLGEHFEAYRRAIHMPDQDIFDKGGVKKDALANFKKGRNISLLNLIKILRGADLLDPLAALIPEVENFSPMQQIKENKNTAPARVRRKKKSKSKTYHWGDE